MDTKEKREQALTLLNYYKSVEGELDLARIEGELEVAKAEREIASIDVERLADGPDPDDLALANARLKEAKTNLEQIEADLADLELVAPFDGEIASSDLKVGEFAGPGLLPLILVDDSEWRIETTDLTELSITDISIGMPVEVVFDAIPDLELTGKVTRINKLGENRLGDITYTVEIKLDELDPRLRWLMTVFVTFDDLSD
jgi:multidrug resistance efflux pump